MRPGKSSASAYVALSYPEPYQYEQSYFNVHKPVSIVDRLSVEIPYQLD